MSGGFVSEHAIISEKAQIGEGSSIWHFTQVREGAQIGSNCTISKSCYIDHDVVIGNNCKIQNNSSIYYKTVMEDGVFIGPHVVCTNDKVPRAVNVDGTVKDAKAWKHGIITIKKGASVGAGSIILPNVIIGEHAMIGAGSVVTKDVPANALVYGNPAEVKGTVEDDGTVIKK